MIGLQFNAMGVKFQFLPPLYIFYHIINLFNRYRLGKVAGLVYVAAT